MLLMYSLHDNPLALSPEVQVFIVLPKLLLNLLRLSPIQVALQLAPQLQSATMPWLLAELV